jgi:hypothetical protein
MSGSEKHWNRPKWLSTSLSHNLEHQLFVIKKAQKAKTMAGLAPGNDPPAAAEAAAAAAAAAGVGGGAGGAPPVGGGPPPPPVSPLALPSPISLAIWDKVAEAERAEFSDSEMRDCQLVINGNDASPGALVLMVSTGAFEPECFLTARMNSARAIPPIELVHSVGDYVVALRQADDLHGHSFAFVEDQVGDQLPSTHLEPETGGMLLAFAMSNVEVPTEAVINAHCAQVNPSVFLPSDAAGAATDLMEVCVMPLMWAPHRKGEPWGVLMLNQAKRPCAWVLTLFHP